MSDYIITGRAVEQWDVPHAILAEEIVRCKDCANASFDEFGCGWCCENCREIKPRDFCAWGMGCDVE